MKYSAQFTATIVATPVRKTPVGETAGDNNVPSDILVKSVSIYPTPTGGVFPDYWVKGTHNSSEWIFVPKESPIYTEENNLNAPIFFYVKTDSGTETMNLMVHGE